MSFLHSILSILGGFFQSYVQQFDQQISGLTKWFGYQIGSFFLFWGISFRPYGPVIPAIFIVALGLSIMGVMGEFTLLDGANKVVGG